jgi:hypothetical protein
VPQRRHWRTISPFIIVLVRDEPLDGSSRIERRPSALIEDSIEYDTIIGVAVCDRDNGVIATATTHVDKGHIQHAVLRRSGYDGLLEGLVSLPPGVTSPTGPVTSRKPVLAIGLAFDGTVRLAA